ncbi:MAG: relaxase/mobilization nuclease domain-containing protein, partial [Bacillota bacterium]
MAVTTIKTIHKQKNKSVKSYLKERIAYITDDTKTENGKYVTSYMCDGATAHIEFNAMKNEYFMNTGRVQESDVLAYQVIQSFDEGVNSLCYAKSPTATALFLGGEGKVTPALANQIGVELAQELTNGEHSFIVATHGNTSHIHNHIVFNSTNVDCQSKWKDVK